MELLSVCCTSYRLGPASGQAKNFSDTLCDWQFGHKTKATGIARTLRPEGAKRSFVPGFALNRSDSAGVGFKAPGRARARGLGWEASTGSGPVAARVVGFKAPGPVQRGPGVPNEGGHWDPANRSTGVGFKAPGPDRTGP